MNAPRRRWFSFSLLALFALMTGTAAVAGVWLWFPPDFTASSTLRVAEREPKLCFTTIENSQPQDFQVYKRRQKEVVCSSYVLNAALRSPRIQQFAAVQNGAPGWLEGRVCVSFPGDDEIMLISFSHGDAATAAAIADAVTKAYVASVVDLERIQRMERLQRLEAILNDAEDKMRSKLTDLKRSADDSSIDAVIMRLDLKRDENMITKLGTEIDMQRIELRSPPRVTEIISAGIPSKRSHLARTMILTLVGFFLPLLTVWLWSAWARRRMPTAQPGRP